MKAVPFPEIKLTRKQMEQRRMLASEDLANGMSQADVARKYNVYPSSVSRWAKKLEKKGKAGLKERTATGQPSKLSENQKGKLLVILVQGAKVYGFENDFWTGKRVCTIIKEEFGVVYNFKYIPRLLRSLGFELMKPTRRAAEKDDAKKEEWLRSTWVQLKKT